MSRLRALHRDTVQVLGAPHALPTLTVPFLFCLLACGTVYLLCRFLAVLALVCLPLSTAELLRLTAINALQSFLVILFVLPIWLGRLRMAGLLLAGEKPLYGECFYYFRDRARYFRALGASAILYLVYGLAGLAVYGTLAGAIVLYRSIFLLYLPRIAPLLLVAVLHVALAAVAGVIYLLGNILPFAAIVVGNESLPLFAALVRALRTGRKSLGKSFAFALKGLLRLALSLASVMVLYVLWYSHYFNLIYLRYSMALTEEVQ